MFYLSSRVHFAQKSRKKTHIFPLRFALYFFFTRNPTVFPGLTSLFDVPDIISTMIGYVHSPNGLTIQLEIPI